MKTLTTIAFVLLAGMAGSSVAADQQIPVMKAEDSRAANPPPPIEPGTKGYGVRAVDGRTLGDMQERCRTADASRPAAEQARCDQLQRTLRTQPGNASQ